MKIIYFQLTLKRKKATLMRRKLKQFSRLTMLEEMNSIPQKKMEEP